MRSFCQTATFVFLCYTFCKAPPRRLVPITLSVQRNEMQHLCVVLKKCPFFSIHANLSHMEILIHPNYLNLAGINPKIAIYSEQIWCVFAPTWDTELQTASSIQVTLYLISSVSSFFPKRAVAYLAYKKNGFLTSIFLYLLFLLFFHLLPKTSILCI